MAEPKNEEFLDDIEQAEAEEQAIAEEEILDSDAEIEALRAEREIGRASCRERVPASAARKTAVRLKTTAGPSSPATCCRSTTT